MGLHTSATITCWSGSLSSQDDQTTTTDGGEAELVEPPPLHYVFLVEYREKCGLVLTFEPGKRGERRGGKGTPPSPTRHPHHPSTQMHTNPCASPGDTTPQPPEMALGSMGSKGREVGEYLTRHL